MPIQRAKPKFSDVKNVTNIAANQLNIGQIGGRRNVIINGGFNISQRNAAALTATANNTYCLDRWKLYLNGSCAVSTQQMLSLDTNVTALNTASGETFNNVLSIDCTTAASLGSTDLLGIIQMIEGYNTVPLAGQVCTLSFHVKTNVTGQYYVALKESGSSERTYLAPYTISSANTWEKKTITFTMDTATNLNNTASVTTGSGLQVYFGMRLGTSGQMSNTLNAWHAGNYYGKSDQVTWGTNTSDTFYLGGIQLEKGSQATAFEHRSFAEELTLCQRYYQKFVFSYFNLSRYHHNAGARLNDLHFYTEMRDAPTGSNVGSFTGSSGFAGSPTIYNTTTSRAGLGAGSGTGTNTVSYLNSGASGYTQMDAEL